ncbi:MAG: phosphate butyryltransferase, partial [Clostridia bacterium]|nr:phosphate butyryltransferase [Clostridia bacterium]
MVNKLSQLIELAKAKPGVTVSVAQAADKEVLEAVVNAEKEGIAKAVLTGNKEKIENILAEIGANAEDFVIIEAETDEECAFKAVEQIRLGNANILMKGLLSTGTFMKAVINRDTGLRTGKTISHTMFYEVPSYGKLLCLTDGGMNTFPDLEKKADILENAIGVVKKLGIEKPSVACVCGAENVDPKVQSTLDADELSKMERFADADVYGPVGLDLAISKEAVHH